MNLSTVLKPGMRGVFYGRHSTNKQEMDMQQVSVYEMVRKYGCTIEKEYLDAGVSAKKNKVTQRKQLMELLADAEQRRFEFIAVYNNDRLARHPLEHQYIRETIRIYGIPIVISSTETLYDEKGDIIAQLAQDGISKYEVDQISKRTRAGLIVRAKKGYWTGGNPPYGYRYLKNEYRFTPYQEEAEFIRRIFDMYKKNEGFASIANSLSLENSDDKWTKEKVRSIITNPFYAGYMSWGKRTGPGKGTFADRETWIIVHSEYIEPIVSKEDWELCWKLYCERRERKVPPKQYKTSYLFANIAICKECNVKLKPKDQTSSGNNGKKYGKRIYFCPTCRLKIEADSFHEYAIDKILNDIRINASYIFSHIQKSFQIDIQRMKDEVSKLEQELGEYNIQLNRIKAELIERMRSNPDDKSKKMINLITMYRIDISKRIEMTEKQIKTKTKQIQSIEQVDLKPESWGFIIQDILKPRDEINQTTLRRMLTHLVEYISIDKNHNIEFKTRYDLDRRKVDTTQLELLF